MLLSDLLHSRVRDADGRDVGAIHDVLLVQGGPLIDGFGHGLVVDGFVTGPSGLVVRLGYHRGRVRGPWLLCALLGALERRAHFVPWDAVASWDDGIVTLAVPVHALAPPPAA